MSGHNLPPVEEEDDFGIPPVVLDTNFPTWIALDGLPKVTKDKLEKLGGVVRKVLGSIGEVRDFIMPFDETTNTTKGYGAALPIFIFFLRSDDPPRIPFLTRFCPNRFAFVEYAKPEHAATAVGKLHGYALDKVHTFKVSKLSDLDLLEKLADEYQAPDVASEPPASVCFMHNIQFQYFLVLSPMHRDF
jgi:translation initiation factor 3 subunit B